MTRVLVIGAERYVGKAVCSELLRSGAYAVYGYAASIEEANELAANEVIPLTWTSEERFDYAFLIRTYRIYVVVDASHSTLLSNTIMNSILAAGQERMQEGGQRLGFVHCSNIWVHGSSFQKISDLDPVGGAGSGAAPPRLISWRLELEERILASREVLNVIIIRPAQVYGREHALWGPIFESILQGSTRPDGIGIPLDPTARVGLVHLDDVASGFRCAVERLPIIAGTREHPVFNLQSSTESMHDIVISAARVLGYTGTVQMIPRPDHMFYDAMSTSTNDDSERAKLLLGWTPRRIGFASSMEVHAKAWRAVYKPGDVVGFPV